MASSNPSDGVIVTDQFLFDMNLTNEAAIQAQFKTSQANAQNNEKTLLAGTAMGTS